MQGHDTSADSSVRPIGEALIKRTYSLALIRFRATPILKKLTGSLRQDFRWRDHANRAFPPILILRTFESTQLSFHADRNRICQERTLPFLIIHNKSPTTQISSRASITDMRIFFTLIYSVVNFMHILLLCCFVTLCNFSCSFYSIGTRFCTFCRSLFQFHKHPDCLKPPLSCCFSCCYNLYPVFLKLSI